MPTICYVDFMEKQELSDNSGMSVSFNIDV